MKGHSVSWGTSNPSNANANKRSRAKLGQRSVRAATESNPTSRAALRRVAREQGRPARASSDSRAPRWYRRAYL